MQKKRALYKIIAVLFAVVFVFAGCNLTLPQLYSAVRSKTGFSGPGGNGTAPGGRNTIPFSEMVYERPDGEYILAEMDSALEDMRNAKTESEAIAADYRMGDVISPFYDAYTIIELKTYLDTTDTYADEEYLYCSEVYSEMRVKLNDMRRLMVEGPFAAQYEEAYGEYSFQNIKNTLLLESEETAVLKKERAQIEMEYNKALSEMVLVHDGQTYTMQDMQSVSTYEEFYKLLKLYYKQSADLFTDYYSRLVNIDKEIAFKLGFTSAADMYYLQYARDYTPQDAMGFAENSKKYFVDISKQIEAIAPQPIKMDMDKTFEKMPNVMSEINSELGEAWNFMIDFELYDYEYRPEKFQDAAFTTEIGGYNAPFCYGNWDGTSSSYKTVVHEFGHFYDFYLRYNAGSVFNLDIAETYSQGLELLFYYQAEEFVDASNVESLQQSHIADFTNPLTFQIAIEEFQQKVYALDTFDSKVIAKLYADVMSQYGIGENSTIDEDGYDYSWFRITHMFSSPFYTVSYWTSAIAALQIWAAGQDDYSNAVDLYTNLIYSDQNRSFSDLLESAGLQSPVNNPEILEEIAALMSDAFNLA